MLRLKFGKYKGQLLEDVPTGYLQWCDRELHDLDAWTRRAIEAELERRQGPPPAPPPPRPATGALTLADLDTRIRAWWRELCLQYHPDRGGDTKVMQALNNAHERLRKAVGAA